MNSQDLTVSGGFQSLLSSLLKKNQDLSTLDHSEKVREEVRTWARTLHLITSACVVALVFGGFSAVLLFGV